MPKRKSIYEQPEPEPEPEETYEVEFISKARVTEEETWEYFIKWGGYSNSDNSWEPESNLTGCRPMLKSFWEQVGPKFKSMAKQLPEDYEVKPSALWIERERKAYRNSKRKKRANRAIVEDNDDEDGEQDLEDNNADESIISKVSKQPPKAISVTSDSDHEPISSKAPKQHRLDVSESSDSDSVSLVANATAQDNGKMATDGAQETALGEHDVGPRGTNDTGKERGQKSLHSFSGVVPTPQSAAEREQARTHQSSLLPSSESLSVKIDPPASKTSVSAPPPKTSGVAGPPPSFTASDSTKAIPAHLQRKLNPRVKPMALPMVQTSGPKGISTKARLSGISTGLAASRPGLRPILPAVGSHPSVIASGSAALDSPKTPRSSVSMDFDASKWIQEIITSTDMANNSPSTSNTARLHFSKRWRWTGQLAVGDNESEDAFAEPVGSISLAENISINPKPNDLSIQQLLPSHVDSLCLRHSYPLMAFLAVLADYRIAHFAVMSANQQDEENAFNDLVTYMVKQELFSLTPLYISDRKVATMFVFPASFRQLWDQLDVPPKIRQGQDLLVAIGFQVYEPARGALGIPIETYSSKWNTDGKDDGLIENRSVICNRALQALSFSDTLFKRIDNKVCAIFPTITDTPLAELDPDTMALTTVLSSAPGCKMASVLAGEARFIFIHVGAWGALHKLVGLVDRRLRRQDVQFYTYGSDPTVEPKYWGVQQVFLTGGVVTFTPRAIAENPQGVEELIRKLDEHPAWTCYVLPSTVAMITEVNSDKEPNSKLKGMFDALCGILYPMQKGQIALTWQPPSMRAWYKENPNDTDLTPKRLSWMTDQAHLSELEGPELVEECQNWLRRLPRRSEKDVEESIINDMVVMQSELRETYRRFVIVTDTTGASNISKEAAARSMSRVDIKDMFEFTHVEQFSFMDDYFS